MGVFERFLKLPIDFDAIGLAQRENAGGYFCTPKGARVIGHTGVDGIHFCCIRKYGEMVFAVSPMNDAPYVRPVAANFEDFLALLLVCGSVDALEQAWMWDEKAFDRYLSENKPDERMQAAFDIIRKELDITLIPDPYGYLYEIRDNFNYNGIPFTEEYYDTLDLPMPAKEQQEWAVYYDGSFWGHHGKAKPGKQVEIGKTFDWEGEQWYVPAVYVCSKGLVVDFCISAEKAQIKAYLDRVLALSEQQLEADFEQLEALNPLHIDFNPTVFCNTKSLRREHGSAVSYLPDDCIPLGERGSEEAEYMVEHYDLDREKGWLCWRFSFAWATKSAPVIKKLVLSLSRDPVQVGSFGFTTPTAQNEIPFTHPVTGMTHTLTLQAVEQNELKQAQFASKEYEFPTHFQTLSYTVTPELEKRGFQIRDTAKTDAVKRILPRSTQGFAPEASGSASIGIIGGADGPVAVWIGSGGDLRTASSSMHFEPVEQVNWQASIMAKPKKDISVLLYETQPMA